MYQTHLRWFLTFSTHSLVTTSSFTHTSLCPKNYKLVYISGHVAALNNEGQMICSASVKGNVARRGTVQADFSYGKKWWLQCLPITVHRFAISSKEALQFLAPQRLAQATTISTRQINYCRVCYGIKKDLRAQFHKTTRNTSVCF